jgi:hypothetical protein
LHLMGSASMTWTAARARKMVHLSGRRSKSRYSASTALTQSLRGDEIERFGAMLTDVMKPVIEMAQSAPTSAATIVSVDIDTLLQKHDAVA